MKGLLWFSAILFVVVAPSLADEIILVYHPGNTLFVPTAGTTITSGADCSDLSVKRLLTKYGMSLGHRIGSDYVNILDGYYAFVVDDGKGEEAADSLTAISSVKVAAINGSVHTLSGATRDPSDYWYNHSFHWKAGFHHSGCDDSQYMPIPHYRQWFLPRGGYDRAWTVTTGDPNNVIAIIDSSFEIDHPDLYPQWAWNMAEYGVNSDVDDDQNGYVDDMLGWDFGWYFEPRVVADSLFVSNGDPDIGHDPRWWEIQGFDHPWDIACVDADCVCGPDGFCDEGRTKSAFGSARHGTNMASIIAAHASEDATSIGMAGINWETKILPIKIGNSYQDSLDVPNSLHLAMAKALEYVAIRKQQGLNIIALNMSLTFDNRGYLDDWNDKLQPIFDPIFDKLRNQYDIVLLGGAGNFNSPIRHFPVYPCRNTDVFCATCVGYYHQTLEYSQHGSENLPSDQENVDLCAYGAEANMKCGTNRDPGLAPCLGATPAGDPFFPEMIIASSETTHRVGWSLCGDVNCAPADSCEDGVYQNLKHVWGVSPFYTSGATAQLSGLVGLVAAAFPDYGPDEIESKILASVDDVYYANPGDDPGDLGAGVTNAWKSVTRWGPLAAGDLWAGDVWISGDITVPAGMELTIAAGTTVHVAFDDVLASGPDPAHTEIIVDGTLTCLGTQAAPVTFEIIGDDPTHEWGPIVVRGTGGQPSIQLEHCTFRDMTSFLTVDLQSGESDVHVSDCEVSSSGDGLLFQPSHSGSSLTLLDTSLTGAGQTLSVGVNLVSGGVFNPTVVLDGLIIDGFYRGVFLDTGDQTTINDVDVLWAESQGAVLAATQGTQPVLNGHVKIHDAGDFGIVVLGGITSVRHVDVLSSDGYGIFQVSPDPVAYDDVTVDDTQFAGIYLDSPAAGTVITNSYIVHSGSDGIRADGGSLEIGAGTQIHTPGQIGVNAVDADVVIHDAVVTYCEGGAQASSGGSLVIADTIFSHSYFGVSAQAAGTADLSAGGSYFGPISGYFIMNGNQSETILARYNCFEGIIPPLGRKFIGLGPIIYTPSTCP